MNQLAIPFLIFLAFKIGVFFERWASGRLDEMEQTFNAGREQGYKDGFYDGRADLGRWR